MADDMDLGDVGYSIAGAEGGHLIGFCAHLIMQGHVAEGEGEELYRRAAAFARACEAADPTLKEKRP